MKRSIAVVLGCIIATGLVWVFFPTSIGATSQTFETLPASRFSALRNEALVFERSVLMKGVVVNAGDERSQSIGFECKGIPLLTVVNGPHVLSIVTYVGADERLPELAGLRERLVSELKVSGAPLVMDEAPSQAVGLERFMLKYRDGLDLSSTCAVPEARAP